MGESIGNAGMRNIRPLSTCLLLLVLCFSHAHGEQKKVIGDYEIHYIALTSTDLTPEVAKQYGIKRSRYLGYLSITVLKKGYKNALDAHLNGEMVNLLGQYKSLEFMRIQEGRAIYFISTFKFDKEEIYSFDIDIKTLKPKKLLNLQFKQKFYKYN